jgi:hypothetical protein
MFAAFVSTGHDSDYMTEQAPLIDGEVGMPR